MGVRYPGPVTRYNLVDLLLLWYLVPVWDRLFATTMAFGVFGRNGATHELAQWGVSRSGRESGMAVGRFCRNAIGPPEWECEVMGSIVWVQCTNVTSLASGAA